MRIDFFLRSIVLVMFFFLVLGVSTVFADCKLHQMPPVVVKVLSGGANLPNVRVCMEHIYEHYDAKKDRDSRYDYVGYLCKYTDFGGEVTFSATTLFNEINGRCDAERRNADISYLISKEKAYCYDRKNKEEKIKVGDSYVTNKKADYKSISHDFVSCYGTDAKTEVVTCPGKHDAEHSLAACFSCGEGKTYRFFVSDSTITTQCTEGKLTLTGNQDPSAYFELGCTPTPIHTTDCTGSPCTRGDKYTYSDGTVKWGENTWLDSDCNPTYSKNTVYDKKETGVACEVKERVHSKNHCEEPDKYLTWGNTVNESCSLINLEPDDNVCVKTATLQAGYTGGANQIKFDIESCSSGWVDGQLKKYNIEECTDVKGKNGEYKWTARARNSNYLTAGETSVSRTIRLDNSSPKEAKITFSSPVVDTNCKEKYSVTVNLADTTDEGCNGQVKYKLAVACGVMPSSLQDQKTAIATCFGGKKVYAVAEVSDGLGNKKSSSATYTIPTLTQYPDINLSGQYSLDYGSGCQKQIEIDQSNLRLSLSATNKEYVSFPITKNKDSYSATISINNVKAARNEKCLSLEQKISLSQRSYPDISNVGWRTNNVCDGASDNSFVVDLRYPYETSVTRDLFFKIDDWFKLANTSFNNSQSGRLSLLPPGMKKFSLDFVNDDLDDDGSHNFILGEGGLLLSDGDFKIGELSSSNRYSQKNWHYLSYSKMDLNGRINDYIEYFKAKRKLKKISNFSDIKYSNTMYLFEESTAVTDFELSEGVSKVIIAVNGDLEIKNDFNTGNKAVAILVAGKLKISSDTKYMAGIFLADEADLARGVGKSSTPLKIKGNLILLSNLDLSKRKLEDKRRPAFFLVFDNKMYTDIMEMIAKSTLFFDQIR